MEIVQRRGREVNGSGPAASDSGVRLSGRNFRSAIYSTISSSGGAVAVAPLEVAVTVTVTGPGVVTPFGPFARPPHAALPNAISKSTVNESAQLWRRRKDQADAPKSIDISRSVSAPPGVPGVVCTAGLDAWQKVLSTIATSLGDVGLSVTEFGSGAQVIVGLEVVQAN